MKEGVTPPKCYWWHGASFHFNYTQWSESFIFNSEGYLYVLYDFIIHRSWKIRKCKLENQMSTDPGEKKSSKLSKIRKDLSILKCFPMSVRISSGDANVRFSYLYLWISHDQILKSYMHDTCSSKKKN